MPSGAPDICCQGDELTIDREKMITAKRALVACALTFALTSSLYAAEQPQDGRTLKLAIGAEPTEGFDPMLGWSHGSYFLLHGPLLKQNADMSWGNLLTEKVATSDDGKTRP